MVLKCCFNIAKLNAVTPNFDHLIATTNVQIVPIILQLYPIAMRIWFISIGWLSPVANHDGRTSNHQFPFFSCLSNSAVLFLCPDTITGAGFPNGDRFIPALWEMRHLIVGANIGLRWAIEIEKAYCMTIMLIESTQMLDRKCFTRKKNGSQRERRNIY